MPFRRALRTTLSILLLPGVPLCAAQAQIAFNLDDLTIGASGWHGDHGLTAVVDAFAAGPRLAVGGRVLSQGLSHDRRAYAGMFVLGATPNNLFRFVRLDLGFGFVGQSSKRALRPHQYFGVGYLGAISAGAFRSRAIQPEVSAWAVGATSAAFAGVSAGLRIVPD